MEPVFFLIAAASASAISTPPAWLLVWRNAWYFLVVAAESIMITLMPAAYALSIPEFSPVLLVGAMTRKSGFATIAFSIKASSAAMSASEGPPVNFRPRMPMSATAFLAPDSTTCQKPELTVLTIVVHRNELRLRPVWAAIASSAVPKRLSPLPAAMAPPPIAAALFQKL